MSLQDLKGRYGFEECLIERRLSYQVFYVLKGMEAYDVRTQKVLCSFVDSRHGGVRKLLFDQTKLISISMEGEVRYSDTSLLSNRTGLKINRLQCGRGIPLTLLSVCRIPQMAGSTYLWIWMK